jgi:hypothetical protein
MKEFCLYCLLVINLLSLHPEEHMPYEIEPGPIPNIVNLRLYGNITLEDMKLDEQLGLNNGTPMYLLMDASEMSLRLPKSFMNGATQSFFINRNLQHMALYTGSNTLDLLATAIANLTGRRDKLSIHKTREQALNHLLGLMGQAGTQS